MKINRKGQYAYSEIFSGLTFEAIDEKGVPYKDVISMVVQPTKRMVAEDSIKDNLLLEKKIITTASLIALSGAKIEGVYCSCRFGNVIAVTTAAVRISHLIGSHPVTFPLSNFEIKVNNKSNPDEVEATYKTEQALLANRRPFKRKLLDLTR